MSDFIRNIRSNGNVFEFSFIRIHTISGAKYFVMTQESIMEYHFVIEKIMGDWKINDAPRVPQWIYDLESQLVDFVIENESVLSREK